MPEPQPLAAALAQVAGRPIPADEPNIELLLALPPTDELANAVDRAEARHLAICPERGGCTDWSAAGYRDARGGDQRHRAAARAYLLAERRLIDGQLRDHLAAEAGCWCLGRGGRGTRGAFISGAGGGFFGTVAFAEYCECPIGVAARSQHYDEALRARDEARRHRRDELWHASVPAEFEDVSFETYPNVSREHRATLHNLREWLESDCWLYLEGRVGRGKTGLAIAAAKAIGVPFLYVSAPDLLGRLRATYDGEGTESELLEQLCTVPLLVLDDLGKQAASNAPGLSWAAERLFAVIDRRWRERRRMVITSNLNLEALTRTLHDEGAIASRIRSRSYPFTVRVDGPDLRQETLP